jgi:hypothetical protein
MYAHAHIGHQSNCRSRTRRQAEPPSPRQLEARTRRDRPFLSETTPNWAWVQCQIASNQLAPARQGRTAGELMAKQPNNCPQGLITTSPEKGTPALSSSSVVSAPAPFSCEIFWRKIPVALFVVIWQNLSNHGLTRFKRFVSTFTDKLCN